MIAKRAAATGGPTVDGVVDPAPPRRSVGRPRQYDDGVERELIVEAGYQAIRELGNDVTIAAILAAAGVSTRSFYRHFESKDALLCAMFRRDAEWAVERLTQRLAAATGPVHAVEMWIDEIFSFVRVARRAERVSVLSSVVANRAAGADVEQVRARLLLMDPLRQAVVAGIAAGTFAAADPAVVTELLAAAVMHAAGLTDLHRFAPADQGEVTVFCLRALGAG